MTDQIQTVQDENKLIAERRAKLEKLRVDSVANGHPNDFRRKDLAAALKAGHGEKDKETLQGLWYDYSGNFTGFIHTKYKFCKNNELPMPFDEDVVEPSTTQTVIKSIKIVPKQVNNPVVDTNNVTEKIRNFLHH